MRDVTCRVCGAPLAPIHLDELDPDLDYCSVPCVEAGGLTGDRLAEFTACLLARRHPVRAEAAGRSPVRMARPIRIDARPLRVRTPRTRRRR